MAWVSISHNSSTWVLTIACTKNVEDSTVDLIHRYVPATVLLSAEREEKDLYNSDGEVHRDCVVYTAKVAPDIIETFFDACRTALRKRISNSINHIDN